MKVAYLFSRYPVPSQTFCDTEMRALEAAGFEVEIYSCSPPTTSFRHGAEKRLGGPVFYAPPGAALEWGELAARRDGRWPDSMAEDHTARYGDRYDALRRARHAVYFTELCRRRGVEHLHVHFANRATHAALFIHELTGIPFSFTAHAQDFLVDLGSDALLGEMCKQAAFVVAVSDWSRRELVKRCPEAEPKIHRIYNGLSLDRWPGADRRETAFAPLRIFSVGRLVEFKGFGDLIAACARLRAHGVAFRCEIAGEGPLRGTLAHQIHELRLADCVTLAGLLPQTEIRARLAACDVFALACRVDEKGACDVLPTVILEAMATERPVVSTQLAGVPEMVEHGYTGLLVTPGDIPALANALEVLSRDPDLRRRFGLGGRRKLETDFSSAGTTRQLAALMIPTGTGASSPPTPARAETVYLLDRWPTGHAGCDAALLALRERDPGFRLVAIAVGAAPLVVQPAAPETLALITALEFLPDAMVLEGEWRERSAAAHRLESLRGSVGGGPEETDAFLLAARRVLYLQCHWQSRGDVPVKRLHAIGPQALRCALVLALERQEQAASFYLAPGTVSAAAGLSGATLRRLAKGFTRGWVADERKLAAELGPNFYGEDGPAALADWQRWMETALTSRAGM